MHWLFPPRSREFLGKIWVKIALRTLHLIGITGLGGAYFYAAPREAWLPFFWLTLSSGLGMLVLEVWSHGVWLLQVRGLAILLKCALLLSLPLLPSDWTLGVILLVLVLSGVFSHAPGRVRHYSPFMGRDISPDDWRPDRQARAGRRSSKSASSSETGSDRDTENQYRGKNAEKLHSRRKSVRSRRES